MRAVVRVIGVGQALRGDDAVGLAVAERLRGEAGIEVLCGAADGAGLLAQIEARPSAILVDCARGGGAPGDVLRLDPGVDAGIGSMSSHGNALAEALALGAALGCLPAHLVIFAVVGTRFGLGEAISPAVLGAVPTAAAKVLEEATCMRPG